MHIYIYIYIHTCVYIHIHIYTCVQDELNTLPPLAGAAAGARARGPELL